MRLLGTLALALLASTAACSGDNDGEEPPQPAATVSTQTTCDQLFVDDDPWLWRQATAAITDGRKDPDVIDQLQDAAKTAGDDLRPHIETMAEAVDAPWDADIDGFLAAAREVANVCAEYVAGDVAG
jgi:hypothetical protein